MVSGSSATAEAETKAEGALPDESTAAAIVSPQPNEGALSDAAGGLLRTGTRPTFNLLLFLHASV
jgi:hypothetical protein